MTRISVIGTGVMGSNHARVISSMNGAELVGVFDQDEQRRNSQAARFSTASLGSVDEAIERSEALVIATPTPSHVDIMKKCLDAGRHFLVEKPVCNERADLLDLQIPGRGIIAMVGHVERFNPAVRYARTMKIAEVHAIAARREGPYSPRIVEGVTRDLMIHDIDLCAYLTGEKLRVLGAGTRAAVSPTEDVSTAVLEGESGFVASLTASRIGQSKVRDIRLTLGDCLVYLDLLQRTVVIYRQSSATFADANTPLYSESLTTQMPILNGYGEPLAAEIECFVQSIRDGHLQEDAASLEDGLRALDLADEIAGA